MTGTDPQFLYMILILPSLFGIILIGEGINKVVHEDWNGVLAIVFGMLFLGIVVFAFFFFSNYQGSRGV